MIVSDSNDNYWKVLKNTLIPINILKKHSKKYHHLILKLLDEKKYFFASYVSNFDQKEIGNFWYIINDVPLSLDAYPTKVRNEIRQSLRKCVVEIVDPQEHWDVLFRLYNSAIDGYKHYNYRLPFPQFQQEIISQIDAIDIWLIKNIQNVPVGYGYVIKNKEYVDLFDIKIDPSQLSCLPVFQLLYQLNLYYLSENDFRFISDGRRSMLHDTQFQTFLEKKFLYRKAYCRLHIVYSTKIEFVMRILRLFKPLIFLLPPMGPIRKLTLLLNYDQISRSC